MLSHGSKGMWSLSLPGGSSPVQAATEVGLLNGTVDRVENSLRVVSGFVDALRSGNLNGRTVSEGQRERILVLAAELKGIGELGQAIETAFTRKG